MNTKRLLACLLFPTFLGAAAPSDPARVPDKIPLKLRYPVGTTLYYRIERLNTGYRLDGTRISGQKMVAWFTRTRLADDPQGKVQERFVWKRFEFGQSLTAAPAKPSEFKAARDFALTLSVNEDMAIEKFDFSSLPRTLDGFFFMILSWDAVTFDGLVRPTPGLAIPDEAAPGAVFRDPAGREFRFSYLPLVPEARYVFSGNNWVRLLGLSRVGPIPCALFDSAMLESKVEMALRVAGLEIQTRGFENFWAKTYLALDDGRILKGELVGPVSMVQDIRRPGQAAPEHSEFLEIGELTMDLLSEAEFKAELAQRGDATAAPSPSSIR